MSRRILLSAVVSLLMWPVGLRAQEADAVDAAVKRGIAFLLTQQDDSGAFRESERKHSNALTGLAVLALASVGHQPTDETPEGRALRRGLDFILSEGRQDASGYYGRDGSRMYGHGIVTLTLAEMLGMGVDARQDTLLRQRCQRAVDLIVRAARVPKKEARFEGGWRYGPDAEDADLSVTVWQVMALRAAKNAGMVVPKETIERAVEYIKRSYVTKRDRGGGPLESKSGFGYQPGSGVTYSTAAEGLLALQVCGEYDAFEVKGAAEWLTINGLNTKHRWFYYGTYYYAQGMYQRGGEFAASGRRAVEEILLALQEKSGSWAGTEKEAMSNVYSTALAVLGLSVKYHYMPIYQR